jgi:outer membrane protein assembly factor BamA
LIQTTLRTLCTILLLLLFAAKSYGQESPRFLIERIDVRNTKRVSPAIVVAESRLDVNRTYTEQELREAADRLQRLPFLLDAQFSLEKGSVRDAFVLVISVQETKPFFFHADLLQYWNEDRGALVESETGALVGFRWFVGRKGAFHVGIEGEEDRTLGNQSYDPTEAQVGYTQYDLFGTRAFATVNLRYQLPNTSAWESSRITPAVVVGVPLTPRQTLTLSYAASHIEYEPARFAPFKREHSEDAVRLRWSYNTTNHPFFPTSGAAYSVTPLFISSDGTTFGIQVNQNGEIEPLSFGSHAYGVELGAAKYWEVSERNSVSITGRGGLLETSSDPDAPPFAFEYRRSYGDVRVGYSHSLWDAARRAVDGESRIEANAGIERAYLETSRGNPGGANRYRTSVSWVRRNTWGTLRLGVGYAW